MICRHSTSAAPCRPDLWCSSAVVKASVIVKSLKLGTFCETPSPAVDRSRRDRGRLMTLHKIAQLILDPRNDIVPCARVILPKQASGRIPGTVVTVQQPAPIGREGQHHPDRLGQRTGEVSDAGVHREDKVQMRYERRGI